VDGQFGRKSPDAFIEAETSEWSSSSGTEHVPFRVVIAVSLNKMSQDCRALVPQRTVAPLLALPMQEHTRWTVERELLDSKVSDFLYSSAGVVENQQQGAVAELETALVAESSEQSLDLFT